MGQGSAIRHEPSLFQHIGVNSSLESKVQPLTDKKFAYKAKHGKENPPATLLTTIKQYSHNSISLAYSKSPGYFWGYPPKEGDVVWILLDEPTRIKEIKISTGSETHKQDYLKSGLLEGSSTIIDSSNDSKKVKCGNLIYIGAFEKGQLHIKDLDDTLDVELQCLRVSVIQQQTPWLIIEEIIIKENRTIR